MKDKTKYWIWSFLITMLFWFVFAALYWIFYKNPVLYDAFFRVFGGSGEMLPPRAAMMRVAVGIIPCTLFIRLAFWALAAVEKHESEGEDDA